MARSVNVVDRRLAPSDPVKLTCSHADAVSAFLDEAIEPAKGWHPACSPRKSREGYAHGGAFTRFRHDFFRAGGDSHQALSGRGLGAGVLPSAPCQVRQPDQVPDVLSGM